MIDLSISIVSYRNFSDVSRLIETIESFTSWKVSKQIYIIDNADEESKYKEIVKKYNDVTYVHTGANLGFGKGHNLVLNQISSRYHAIVNPDIILKEDSFSKIIAYMDKNNEVGMCVPRIIDEQGNLQYVCRKKVTVTDMFIRMFARKIFTKRIAKHELRDKDYSKSFQVPFAQGSFLVIDTTLLIKLEGFDERYFMYMEDVDLCYRVNEQSKLMYFPGTEVIHKWEKGSHKKIKLFMYHVNSMIRFFDKWGVKWF